MSNKRMTHDRDKLKRATIEKKRGFGKGKPSLIDYLENHPVLFIAGTILSLVIIACLVWFVLRGLQACLRHNGINWFSMDAGLFNWFSLFIGYTGAIATVVLGILTVRLTIKQDRRNDYAAISELQLSDFSICDFWHEYSPSRFERDLGRRFVLAFDIEGLKAYYSVRGIELSWKPAREDSVQYTMLENQEVLYQSTSVTKVMAYFDEFQDCGPEDSIYYFLRLELYEPKMMPPEDRRRWLQVHIKLDYADGKMESDVYCEYLLEYDRSTGGTACPKPVDRRLRVSSRPKRCFSEKDH